MTTTVYEKILRTISPSQTSPVASIQAAQAMKNLIDNIEFTTYPGGDLHAQIDLGSCTITICISADGQDASSIMYAPKSYPVTGDE